LITQIIFGEQYRSLSSSLFCCLHSPVISGPIFYSKLITVALYII
jgi:hypothetical protein